MMVFASRLFNSSRESVNSKHPVDSKSVWIIVLIYFGMQNN